jgi:hypothetical protein
MLSLLWTKLSKNLYVIGTAVLGVLAVVLRMQSLKKGRDRARDRAEILEATIHAERVKKQIIKEKEEEARSRRADLIKELNKEGEEFEGVDNLTDSNDY